MTDSDASDSTSVVRALQGARAALAAGRQQEADLLLARAAERAPNHPAVLNELGVQMLARGAPQQARALLARATVADPAHPALWANLAASLKALNLRVEELDAIERALALDPRHLSALLQKAAHFEDRSDVRTAARIYQHAMDTLPTGAADPAHLRVALEHGRAVIATDRAALIAALDGPLAAVREKYGGARQRRVDLCIETLMGARRRYYSHPTWMYFPELPSIEFFEREDLPWLDAFEAAYADMRSEMMGVLVGDRDEIAPYIDFPDTAPLDQFRELNRSRRWGAYFLWNQGEARPDHIARCPVTARLLELAPRCHIRTRAPTAFFSILDAQTRIPPHTGVTNTRLTVHVPLVVPPGCSFRVGGTTREWEPGRAWVFDDTIDHEAWNDSDVPRGILIFDIWNPLLTAVERELITVATETFAEHYSLPPEVIR